MNGYYSKEELKQFNFRTYGTNVMISRKASLYATTHMSFGNNVRIDDFCVLIGNITLGNNVHIAAYSSIHASGDGEVIMNDFSGLSSHVTIYAGSDNYSGETMTNPTVPVEYLGTTYSKICIGRHCILGTNCVLLPGASVGEGTALGAMTLLAKPTEDWSIYAGVPAKKVKDRSRGCLELEQKFKQKYHVE